MLPWGIALSVLYFVSNTVFAAGIGFTSCEDLLKPASAQVQEEPRPLDYVIADFEDFYLELIQDTIELSKLKAIPLSTMENYLNQKASMLNRLSDIARSLRMMNPENHPASANLTLLAAIAESFGVGLDSLGMERTEDGEARFSGATPPPWGTSKGSIGFVDFSEKVESDPLDGKRSIGFAPFRKKEEPLPRRRGGRIDVRRLEASQVYLIGDFEKEVIYEIPARFLLMAKATTADREISLEFDSDQSEWILRFTNHLNPDGKIGF